MSELYLNAEQQPPKKVLLLGLDLGKFDPDRSMEELSALAEANNMEPVAQLVQKRAAPEAGTVLGEGKLAEAAPGSEEAVATVRGVGYRLKKGAS